jgi:hypothetical protein
MAVTLLVVVLFSFVNINFGPSVGFERKAFGNFIFKLRKRNGDDDGTLGRLIGDSTLLNIKKIDLHNFASTVFFQKDFFFRHQLTVRLNWLFLQFLGQ